MVGQWKINRTGAQVLVKEIRTSHCCCATADPLVSRGRLRMSDAPGERSDPVDEPLEEHVGIDVDSGMRALGHRPQQAVPVGDRHSPRQCPSQFDVDRGEGEW